MADEHISDQTVIRAAAFAYGQTIAPLGAARPLSFSLAVRPFNMLSAEDRATWVEAAGVALRGEQRG